MTNRRIDREQAARHLAMLDRPGIPHLIAIIREAPGAKGGPVRHILGTLSEVGDALDHAQCAGAGVFVTVNCMRGRRRLKSEVTRIRAVWCERDQPGRSLALPPSLRVRTSPGRGHDYLIADPAEAPTMNEADLINRAIADQFGGDAQACDAARVLRLAGSWHLKREPFRVEIIGGTGEVYGRQTLVQAFPAPTPQPRQRLVQINTSDRYVTATVNGLLLDLSKSPVGQRNAALNRAAFRLGQLGFCADRALPLLTPTATDIGLRTSEINATVKSGVVAGSQNMRRAA
jgi:hypothetical protein